MAGPNVDDGEADRGARPRPVAAAYDEWAASYDSDANATRDLDAEVLRGAGLTLESRDVLELGCGTGKNTAWLASGARSIVAVDFSAGMLAQARARVSDPRVSFVQHDIRAPLPLTDGSCDLVVGNLVLEHVASLEPIYAEAARVLRPGGEVWFCELHPERQRRGGQAHFTSVRSGEVILVEAHLHTISEYVNGGLTAGLRLRHLGEWLERGAPAAAPPRLVSVWFQKDGVADASRTR